MKLNLLPNEGTEIHRPVTENQVVKMSTSFSVTLQGLLKIRCRHPALDFTRNGIRESKCPSEKPDELRAGIRKSLPVSLPGARVQRAQLFAPVI